MSPGWASRLDLPHLVADFRLARRIRLEGLGCLGELVAKFVGIGVRDEMLEIDPPLATRLGLFGRHRDVEGDDVIAVTHAAIDDYGLPTDDILERALAALSGAECAGERIVAHCAAGMGRTGLISSAWRCRRYGLAVDDAIAEVCESAWRVGSNRDPLEAGPEARDVLIRAGGRSSS